MNLVFRPRPKRQHGQCWAVYRPTVNAIIARLSTLGVAENAVSKACLTYGAMRIINALVALVSQERPRFLLRKGGLA